MAEKGIMTRPFKKSPAALRRELQRCRDWLEWDSVTTVTRKNLEDRIKKIELELEKVENAERKQNSPDPIPVRKGNAVDWAGRLRFRRHYGRFPRLFEGHYIW